MHKISSADLREKYLAFFESKGHVRIPAAPLVPEHDASVLFTTAGMHPLVPYLKGEKHPQGVRLTNAQRCLRTTDINEVGDMTHATVFEMLGNWSLGDYFKEDSITWSWEFLTSEEWLGIDPDYLAVSVFSGDKTTPRDDESAQIWKKNGVPEKRIAYLDANENWWPAGGGQPGPQGPDTEIFYFVPHSLGEGGLGTEEPPKHFDPEDKRWVEIWNNVFMQYDGSADGKLIPLAQQNVDTGMGLERTVMILGGHESIYDIDTFEPLFGIIHSAGKREDKKHERIIADHIKAATFLLGDNEPVLPSNTDRGYVLRRLIRRAVRSARVLQVEDSTKLLTDGAALIVEQYGNAYPSLSRHTQTIQTELKKEISRFEGVIERGLKKFSEYIQNPLGAADINGEQAFELYATYGFPIELTQELAAEHKVAIDMGGFEEALQKHQEKSRTAAAGKFAGGLADHSPQSIKYHTTTHLLHEALRDVLGGHVFQKGSNITPQRLRFDFSHPKKMTGEEIEKTENLVNEKIRENLAVTREEMTVEEAKERGALGLFEDKYAKKVTVYSIGDFSCEICGGPHVANTGDLGVFKITKEESAGAGIRRIKAVLE